MQRDSKDAKAVIVSQKSEGDVDTIVLDLKSAYDVCLACSRWQTVVVGCAKDWHTFKFRNAYHVWANGHFSLGRSFG
jgi:hypothetical protein